MEETTGQLLRSRREEKGISLEEAAQETRIKLSYLKALEEDDLNSLPGSAYRKGFLHNYGKFLEIEELEEQYQQEQLLTRLLPEKEKPRNELKGKIIFLLSGVLLISFLSFLLYYYRSPLVSLKPARDLFVDKKEYIPLPKVEEQETSMSTNKEQVQLSADSEPVEDLGKSTLVPLKEQEKRVLASQETQEEKTLVLSVSATEEVWVRVVTDQKETFTFLLYPSNEKTFRAREKIKIRMGNAGGLNLKLNDKDLGSPGKSGQVMERVFTNKN